jgi:transposase
MTSSQISFPPVPKDTFLAATALHGRGNIYIRLGDQLEHLLEGLLTAGPKTIGQGSRSFETQVRPALLTILQYVEELTNEQILEAVRSRPELKYALRLPLNSPGVSLNALCEYHQALFAEPARRQLFQEMLERLAEFGLANPTNAELLDARRVLATVCAVSQLDEATRAMYQALEALVVADAEWLRKITRPTWYDRYNRSSRLAATSFSDLHWNARAQEILGDIQYLLQAVDQRHSPQLAALVEIQRIRQILQEQILICIDETAPILNYERMITECNICTPFSKAQDVYR